jgi:BirA family biotin operon repressor/biotin-[acetyl-CoA-carboxylase] ligase
MKSEILRKLKENKDSYISGQELSQTLNVSRTTVWKLINEIKSDGYVIESSSRKGYKLIEDLNAYNYEELNIMFKDHSLVEEVFFFDSLDSTSKYLKDLAFDDVRSGLLAVADEQVAGKGRLGRTWVSPKGEGVWMSLLVRPDIKPIEASKLTQIAAVSIVEAIEQITGLKAGIKWPNDIIVNGKKIAGILTEMNAEMNLIHYMVIGMGINANTKEFPEDLKEKASSLFLQLGKLVDRKELVLAVINKFDEYYKVMYNSKDYLTLNQKFKEKSVTIGKQVRVIGKVEKIATAIDINENGELIVRLLDDTIETIYFGEVSVRGIDFYI